MKIIWGSYMLLFERLSEMRVRFQNQMVTAVIEYNIEAPQEGATDIASVVRVVVCALFAECQKNWQLIDSGMSKRKAFQPADHAFIIKKLLLGSLSAFNLCGGACHL